MDKLIQSLHPLERTVLPTLKIHKDLDSIIKASKLSEVEVMRALQWLENKNILKINQTLKEIIELDKHGEIYIKKGLPEKHFLKVLEKPLTLNEIQEKAKLDKDELNSCIGILKRDNLIKLGKKISITKEGKDYLKTETNQEKFLKSLPLEKSKLTKEQESTYKELKQRKQLIQTEIKKLRTIELTPLGKKLITQKLETDLLETITTSMLKTKSWKNKKFRRFDIKGVVPKIYPGKKHFVQQSIEYIKKIWLDMGFKEMQGPLLESAFWNFDALFVPQDHPAREMQDTFFIKGTRELPDKAKEVKQAHENSWKYKWNPELAKKLVLRTHTTAVSARTLANLKKSDLPAKFFSVGKVFRNEAVDWKHSFEFTQVEGIVIDPNANFQHLLGFLRAYYKKLGFDRIKFLPAYFPYTEMSVEVRVYNKEKKQWVEAGGAGIFRPEVVKPLLGIDIPVLAWGQGMDRSILDYYGIKDLRDLHKNDLKQIRDMKVWLKCQQ